MESLKSLAHKGFWDLNSTKFTTLTVTISTEIRKCNHRCPHQKHYIHAVLHAFSKLHRISNGQHKYHSWRKVWPLIIQTSRQRRPLAKPEIIIRQHVVPLSSERITMASATINEQFLRQNKRTHVRRPKNSCIYALLQRLWDFQKSVRSTSKSSRCSGKSQNTSA